MARLTVIGPPLVYGAYADTGFANAGSNSYTFLNRVPARSATVRVVVAGSYRGGAATLNSVTLAGVSATVHQFKGQTAGSSGTATAFIASASVGAGAAGNCVLSLSGFLGANGSCAAYIFVLENGAYRAGSTGGANAASTNASVTTVAGELVIGAFAATEFSGGPPGAVLWTNLTEAASSTADLAQHSSALAGTGGESLTVTGSSAGADGVALAIATFSAV